MPDNFYDRLYAYLGAVGSVLRGEAEAASIFPNTSDVGQAREMIYAEFLRNHIPANCNVFLGGFVFDIEGNEIKTLVNDWKRAGKYVINWDGTNNLGLSVKDGLYIYQLIIGEKRETGRLMLVK